MIQWMVLTAMTAVAAVMVASPFIRRLERRRVESLHAVEIFKDQLNEVERDAQLGVIDGVQAEAARVEIKKRLLASAQNSDALTPPLWGPERAFASVGVTAIVAGGAVGLFALTGNFDARPDGNLDGDAPVGERFAQESVWRALPDVAKREAAGSDQMPREPLGADANKSLPSVDEMIQRVLKRLEANPKDIDAWRMLGWSYFGVERYKEAAEAYGKAIELAPDAGLRGARAEALIRAASGAVTPEAKVDLDEALKLDPKDPRARYFLGLAKEQAGDEAGAQAHWKQLAADGDPNEPFIRDLRQKLGMSEAPAGAKADVALPAPRGPSSASGERGRTSEDVKQAEDMSPEDRMAMIRKMVDSLADRLEKSPHDADGWIKLMRSRAVLKETGRAREAFAQAMKVFESEPAVQERIAATGKNLGLTP